MPVNKITPIALFFYVDTLSQADAAKVEAYYARGGYRTYFRRDVAGQKDIVEKHVKIVGGGPIIPQRYIAAYQDDTTRILDNNTLAAIVASDTIVPPTSTQPIEGAAMAFSAPVDGEGFGAETTSTEEAPVEAPTSPEAPAAPSAPVAPPAP